MPFPGAVRLPGELKDEPFDVTIRLRAPTRAPILPAEELGRLPLRNRQYLTRSEFRNSVLPSSANIEIAHAFAKRFGLSVIASSAGGRSLQGHRRREDVDKIIKAF